MTQSSAVFQTTPVVPSLQTQRNLRLLNALHLWADLTTLLATLDANNNIIQRYNYTDQRVPTSMQQNGETYYLHYDQVGTLKAITDTNHNIIKEITYDTYGNILQDSNPSFKIPFGFAGGLQDQDTQLVHFGYREYDPYTGKWTSKDPIDFNGGDSNLYGYVLQDPINFIDPTGEFLVLVPLVPYIAPLGATALTAGYLYFNPPPAYYGSDVYCATGDKMLSPGEIDKLKRGGEDIHDLKGGKNASKRDLYKNKNGDILVKPKGGSGLGEPTGLNINDF